MYMYERPLVYTYTSGRIHPSKKKTLKTKHKRMFPKGQEAKRAEIGATNNREVTDCETIEP